MLNWKRASILIFNSLVGKTFYQSYLEPGAADSIRVAYTKNDLLDRIVERMLDQSRIAEVQRVIAEIIEGNHAPYITERFDNIFKRRRAPDGLRISVYCADQAAYNKLLRLEELYHLYPFLRGYHINDVYQEMCDCWKVPPVRPQIKQPFYSSVPALLGDGALDAACRPLYIDLLHHYLPNSWRVLMKKRGHGAFGWEEGRRIVQQFLDAPHAQPRSSNPQVQLY